MDSDLSDLGKFIKQAVRGDIGPTRPRRFKNVRGNQIHEMPFEECVDGLCGTHQIDPISLYREIQGGINRDMLHRLNRSQIFRNKLQTIVCDEWGNCEIADMFADNLQNPFDVENLSRGSQAVSGIHGDLSGYEGMFQTEHDPSEMRGNLTRLHQKACECDDTLKQHMMNLNENYSQYQPQYPDVWNHLATKEDSYYRDGLTREDGDKEYEEFARKQVKRVIPEDIKHAFLNGSLLPTLMRKENRKLSGELQRLRDLLTKDIEKLKYLIDRLPESSEATETQGFFEEMFNRLIQRTSDTDDEESEAGDKTADIRETVESIVKEADKKVDEDEGESDDGEGESDDGEGESDDGEEGGETMFNLSFY